MTQIKELQNCLLGIIVELDKICRENNIHYTLMGGSLIGAIRHNGFIPWDDDVDIGLQWDDYKRLLNILSSNNHPWLTVDYAGSSEYEEQFAKVYDKRTTLKECNSNRIKGVFVDIFPIIPIANSMFIAKLRYYYDNILKMARYNMTNDSKSSRLKMIIYKFVGLFYTEESITKHIQQRREKFAKKN